MTNQGHAELSGSTSHRWIRCPGSVHLIRTLQRSDKPSTYGREGTFAHAVAAHILRGGSIKKYIDDPELPFEFEDHGEKILLPVPPEMPVELQPYIDFVREHAREQGIILVEEHVSLEFVREGMWGTTDAGIPKKNTLVVADLKYGYVPVRLINHDLLLDTQYGELGHVNSQLLYYAAGLSNALGWTHKTVTLAIVQPRCMEVPAVQSIEIPTSAVREWAENDLWKAAHAATTESAPLIPGDQCRFCPAMDICPASREVIQQQAGVDFADVPTTPPVPEDPADLSRILKWSHHIDAWIKACNNAAFELAMQGVKIDGQKIVRKDKHRIWPTQDPTELANMLNDTGKLKRKLLSTERLMRPPELKSPAEVEKFLGKDAVKQVAIKPLGDFTLAPLSARQPAVNPKGDFDDVDILDTK